MKPRSVEAKWEIPGPGHVIAVRTHDDRVHVTVSFAPTGVKWTKLQARELATGLMAAADWLDESDPDEDEDDCPF